jgi:hypothetical protein
MGNTPDCIKPGVSAGAAPENNAALRTISPVSTRDKIRRLLWSMVQNTLYRYSFHTWSGWRAFLLRCFGAKIGRRCTIRRTSRVHYPWLLEMGDLACLGDEPTPRGQVPIGNVDRNRCSEMINGQFKTPDARIKTRGFYPKIHVDLSAGGLRNLGSPPTEKCHGYG